VTEIRGTRQLWRRSGPHAYAIDTAKLPAAHDGFRWRVVEAFRPGEAVLNDPGLKAVFERALKQGFALVTP
jgi:hypothetical protein